MKKILLAVNLLFALSVSSQKLQWARRIGNSSDDFTKAITVDKQGNIYTVGSFMGTLDFDPGYGTSNLASYNNSADIYILKLDSLGNLVWRKRMGGVDEDVANAVAVDDSGNVYTTGKYEGTADFDPGAAVYNLTGHPAGSPFVSKLDKNGNFIWAKSTQGPSGGIGTGSAIAIDNNGNVITGGTYIDSVDFDPANAASFYLPYSLYAEGSFYFWKLNANGDFVWVKGVVCDGSYSAFGQIIVDSSGSVIGTGSFSSDLDLDPGSAVYTVSGPPTGSQDVFILKLNASGNFIWGGSVGGYASEDYVLGLTSDPAGSIYLTGSFTAIGDFDPDPVNVFNISSTSVAFRDVYILKLNSSGNFVWVKTIGSSNVYDQGTGIVADDSGFVYTTGIFQDTSDFDPGLGTFNMVSAGSYDIFLQKMDTAGNFVWAKRTGGTNDDRSSGIAVNTKGDIYTAGIFKGQCDFNPDSLNYSLGSLTNGFDNFIQKLSQDPCSDLTLVIDSARDVTCSGIGRAVVHGLNGLINYTYRWNTIPVVTTAAANFTASGVYNIKVKDAIACERSANLIIGGTTAQSSFDLNANLVAGNFRSGFPTSAWLDAFNSGCVPTTNGQLQIVLDSLVNFNGSSIVPSFVAGDTLRWTLGSLIFDSAHFVPQLFLSTSPLALPGDTVCFQVKISPLAGDADTTNNVKTYCFPVRVAFDPNYKQVYPQGICVPNYVAKDKALTYTIHFQNTGNDTAINVLLVDTISNALDLYTVKVVGSSHKVITEFDSTVLKFHFNSIMLPDSGHNQDKSNGYIIFEITPKATSANYTMVQNTSHIYFDYNVPVATNSVSNTLIDVVPAVCTTVGLIEGVSGWEIVIYPNPASTQLSIETNDIEIQQVNIYNTTGSLVSQMKELQNKGIDISQLASGVYIAEIKTKEGSARRRWVKM